MVRVERDWTEAAPEVVDATGRAWLSPDQMVARFAGPALLIATDGDVRAANAGGRLLLAAVAERLRDQVIRTLIAHVPWITRIEAAFGDERRVFDLTLLPLAGGAEDGVLILGREATLKHNLARALADSRARYRDLVSCSADFAWETDADGRFILISPSGALGHAAEDLVDRPFTLLTGEAVPGDGESPFACHWPRTGVEVRLSRVDGEVVIVEISCLPGRDAGTRSAGRSAPRRTARKPDVLGDQCHSQRGDTRGDVPGGGRLDRGRARRGGRLGRARNRPGGGPPRRQWPAAGGGRCRRSGRGLRVSR